MPATGRTAVPLAPGAVVAAAVIPLPLCVGGITCSLRPQVMPALLSPARKSRQRRPAPARPGRLPRRSLQARWAVACLHLCTDRAPLSSTKFLGQRSRSPCSFGCYGRVAGAANALTGCVGRRNVPAWSVVPNSNRASQQPVRVLQSHWLRADRRTLIDDQFQRRQRRAGQAVTSPVRSTTAGRV